nr:hypothetical protein CTI12_AA020100 [Tanacetum cinerariifolium]
MTPRPSVVLILALLFFTASGAQDRAPHGLANNLMALPPSAYTFFHPNAQLNVQNPCEVSNCSPLPLAATVQSSLAHESRVGGPIVGAGGIAAIIFSFVFVILVAMGVYYVLNTRRANLSRNSTVIPSV